jgi:hypothetical protein
MMGGASRISCVVPFCVRTTAGQPPTEWICRDHWKPIAVMQRRAFSRAFKTRKPELYWPLWNGLKRRAIELAAGISR